MQQTQKIAFLGTGIMGAPMAKNLLAAGYKVSCYNRTQTKTATVVEAGGVSCATPAEAAQDADVVISIVTDGPDVENVLFGEQGAMSTLRSGALCIDMSTISPEVTRQLGERAAQQGVRFMDAPVTGGEIGAIQGTLSIIVGGSEEDYAEAQPIFEVLGKTITHCGPVGAGQVVKLCNQICGAMNLLGVCEALTLGQKMGIDPAVIQRVISAGAGSSWAMQNLAPKINNDDFNPGFMIDTQQKDMRLVADLAEQSKTPLPGAALAQQLWRSAQAAGAGKEGIQGMVKVLRRMANF
jgi:3-hydroxyisobutyrate dehydrogenase